MTLDQIATRKQSRAFQSLKEMRRTRYCIHFNFKGSYDPKTGRHATAAWPLLFNSYDEAALAMQVLPIFANSQATAHRGRLVSACIEKVMLPKTTRSLEIKA